MTPKHHERIVNLIAALEDYELNAEFKRVDNDIHEYNSILTLITKLKLRLKEPVDEDLG